MKAEHLLDAMGLLDDDLIQEAEEYRRPRFGRNYGVWLGWAASFAVVLVLGYGVSHFGMGGGSSTAPAGSCGGSSPASSAPSGPSGDETEDSMSPPAESESQFPSGEWVPEPGAPADSSTGDLPQGNSEAPGIGCESFDAAVEFFGMERGQTPAIMVDGTVYWYWSETAVVRPDGLEVRESTSRTQGIPEEDGQINFPRDGVRYVVLEEGRVGVNWNDSYEWMVFVPVPPEEN